jgi:hypothetical protein
MEASIVAVPQDWETFLFVAPAAWPLSSGDPISLDVCNSNWDRAGYLVRVDHNVKTFPPKDNKSEKLVSYEFGGPGAAIWVRGPFDDGYPAYRADSVPPAEWVFDIVKIVGGGAANSGTPINSGDLVSLRINTRYGSPSSYLFRVTGGQDGAEVDGDGTALGQAGTVFTAEFSEVRSGLGWRPAVIKCQSCAVVTAKVMRTGTAPPKNISNAKVTAQVPGHPFTGTTGMDGRATLDDGNPRHNCIPNGTWTFQAEANRHQTKTVSWTVPDAGNIEVAIQLDCTQVKGKVVDQYGNGLPGRTVKLRDQSNPPKTILDENGVPYQTTTDANGNFVFNCVPHEFVQVWTTADTSQTQHTKIIPPEGWLNVTIVVQTTCGNLVGKVTDAATGQPIAGATVTEAGGRQETTDANGCFTFKCLKPAGDNELTVEASGYTTKSQIATVPATGNFDCQNPPSNPVDIKLSKLGSIAPIMAYQIRLDWGTQPSDLDAHLSGPNPAGGRFHLFYANRGQPPVAFAGLDLDDTTALGPETITIRRSPATAAGVFVAGDYHYWVHDYTATYDPTATFVGSDAAISVTAEDAQGNLSLIGYYEVINAMGNEDDLWHVVDLTFDANGIVSVQVVQTFQPGDQNTVL